MCCSFTSSKKTWIIQFQTTIPPQNAAPKSHAVLWICYSHTKKCFSSLRDRGQGESDGPQRGHCVTKRWHWWPEKGSSYSPGVTDAEYSLSPPKTVCARWRAISYERWPCHTEHSRSKGVNLEKQSPILQCECRAYGMNGSGWVCLKQHTLEYEATSQA